MSLSKKRICLHIVLIIILYFVAGLLHEIGHLIALNVFGYEGYLTFNQYYFAATSPTFYMDYDEMRFLIVALSGGLFSGFVTLPFAVINKYYSIIPIMQFSYAPFESMIIWAFFDELMLGILMLIVCCIIAFSYFFVIKKDFDNFLIKTYG